MPVILEPCHARKLQNLRLGYGYVHTLGMMKDYLTAAEECVRLDHMIATFDNKTELVKTDWGRWLVQEAEDEDKQNAKMEHIIKPVRSAGRKEAKK